MVLREYKGNTYAKFWKTNKKYYGIFESGLLQLSFKAKKKNILRPFEYIKGIINQSNRRKTKHSRKLTGGIPVSMHTSKTYLIGTFA